MNGCSSTFRIKGVEMISAPDGNGNYIPMLPSSYVFSAKATEFLWKLATERSLPQAMYIKELQK